ncbi:MAG: glycosyltransferase family 4 protein [Phycisphaerae bacterium]|nr:glycosyltransferase family 4 protein [Phycisphaerae bacterium]
MTDDLTAQDGFAVDPERIEGPRRLVLCLVADEQAIDRFPTAVRYLQIGLLDEAVDTVLVIPEHNRAKSLISGPTTVVTHRNTRWPLARWARRGVIAQVRRRIDALRAPAPVIVHAMTASVAALAADMAAATGGDLIVNLSSALDINSPDLAPHTERVATFITPSQRVHRAVTASSAIQAPIEIVRFGAPALASPAAFSAPQLAPALVFAGELSAGCGVEAIIRAAKRVLQSHPNLLVFIIGKGPAESSLRHLVDALGLSSTITFTGRLEHWRTVLEAADIFCLPRSGAAYREEPIHALAAGLAVIAAEGSPYDGMIDEQTALLFPEDDEARLADQICRLLDNHEFARSLAITAQSQAKSRHSIAKMVSDHVRIYRQLESRSSTLPLSTGR